MKEYTINKKEGIITIKETLDVENGIIGTTVLTLEQAQKTQRELQKLIDFYSSVIEEYNK